MEDRRGEARKKLRARKTGPYDMNGIIRLHKGDAVVYHASEEMDIDVGTIRRIDNESLEILGTIGLENDKLVRLPAYQVAYYDDM